MKANEQTNKQTNKKQKKKQKKFKNIFNKITFYYITNIIFIKKKKISDVQMFLYISQYSLEIIIIIIININKY